MKKVLFSLLLLAFGLSAMAQQIQLRSVDKVECVKSDMTSLKASFSFSTIDAQDYESERGTFSWLSMPNTVIGGNEGDPQIPVINQLIAVPFGAQPRIEITNYSTTDYRLEDLGIKTLVPRQPSLRKDKRPEDVPFVYNANAYQTRGLRSEPTATVGVEGTMRGVQLGKMTIEPVSYDPVNNTLRVFNDIEVTVHFDGADARANEDMLIKTYSPYFDIVYKQLFNGRAIMDAYSDHTDLYTTPVKMLVVATSAYQNSTAFQNWLTWKKQKGIDVDIYTVTSSTASSTIRTEIQSRYNANHPTFLVIIGDETVVKAYKTNWSCGSTYGNCINDLEYVSVDNDVYHDMYMSRMSVSSTTELENLVNKILTYEKYTMSDPSYLNNSLLVAGWDSNWTSRVGKPTIQYANNNYYNSAHGINPTVFITTGSGQTAAWNNINNVGFVNYTAHGDIQELADPEFTNTNANNMTNNDKYLWIVANCCLTANWGNNTYKPCLGETMIRAANKGAFGYIGSIPESYWYEDYYFGVGAFRYVAGTVQTPSSTTTGMYDALFDDTGFNTLNSVPYIGNVAVTYAHAANYTSSVTDEYYWRAYQCLGDGSVMPYLNNPVANNVSHASALQIGATSFTVNADARSYVSITVNNEIIGVATVPADATSVSVPITAQTTAGTAMIVVTRNQRQPYITTIPIRSDAQYTITAEAIPGDGGTVNGAGTYYANSECTLTATANHGYAFDNWKLSNTVVSTNPTYTFTVSGNADYTANFHALTQHHITYTPNQEHGTISVSPTDAYAGDVITLTATPDAGYRLDHWVVNAVGGASVTVTNNQFSMPDSDVTVSAVFNSGYSVTVASLIGGTITASANTAQAGDVITLSVAPNTGYTFMSWNVYQTSNPSNTIAVANNRFTMPAYDVTVSAVFGTSQMVNNVVNVGGTSGTTNSYFPTYGSSKYSLTEQIYTATELGSAGTITGIDFYFSGTTARARTLQIYMVNTSKTSFSSNTDWIKPTSSNMVYSGSVTFAASSWTTITFSTPFTYDGSSNVALIVDDNTNSTGSTSFHVYTGSNNQAIRANGTTNYNPTSISTNGTRAATKNIVNFHITQNEIQPLACEGPASVAVSTTPTSATVSWSGEADSYNLRYRVSDAFVYDFESAEPWAVDNFPPCTTYDGDGQTTYALNGATFTNQNYTGACIAFQNGITDNFSAHGGNAFGVMFNATSGASDDWFILPEMTIKNGDVFSFWIREITTQYGDETINVGICGSADGTFSSYLAQNLAISTTDWTQLSYDLSRYAGQTIRLAINCVSEDIFGVMIDDISVGNPNSGTGWDETIVNVSSPYTIEGLNDETLYEVQVQGVCEGIGGSEWAGTSFSTLSWCSTPTNLYATTVSATSANLNWTGYQESYNVQYRTAGSYTTYLYESFESGLPSTWTTSGLASNTGVYSGAPNTGTYMYGFVPNSASQYLISPALPEFEAGSTVEFYHLAYSGNATIKVGYSSTTNAVSAFTWGSAVTVASSTSYALYSAEVPAGTKYIGIQVTNVAGSYYLLDDFGVYSPYVEPGEWQTVNSVTSPSTINRLNPETTYEWQVQGNCSEGTTGWSATSTFTTHSLCDAPVGLTTSNITTSSATLSWIQDLGRYNVQYRTSAIASFYEDFDGAIGDWSVYNLQSGSSFYDGYGVDGTTCFLFMYTENPPQYLISPDLNDGIGGMTLKFAYKAYSAEYTETFLVGYFVGEDIVWENEVQANSTDWTEYESTVPEGATNFVIQCTSNDQYALLVDNFRVYARDTYVAPGTWTTLFNNVAGPVAADRLNSNTRYDWRVQGIDCGGGTATDWSSYATFTTAYSLTAGSNWWTPTTTMTLEQLEQALGSNAVLINSQDAGFARYEGGQWSGTLTEINPGQMYKIEATTPVSLTMSGTPATNVSMTIISGYNWFGYTGAQATDIATALGNLGITPASGDTLTDKNGNTASYNGSSWNGSLTTLQPGHGYVYRRQ